MMCSDQPSNPQRPSALWPALCMGAILVLCKAWRIKAIGWWSVANAGRWLRDLLVASAADALFALAFGLASAAILYLVRRRTRLRSATYGAIIAVGTLFVIYGVANIEIVDYIRKPLTYQHLYAAHDPGSMWSSVIIFVNWKIVLGGLAAVAAFLAGSLAAHRLPLRLENRRFLAGVLAAIALWFIFARLGGATLSNRAWALNPHTELAASFFRGAVSFRESFPPDYADDFKTVAERGPGAAAPTPSLRRGPRNVIVVVCESVGVQQLSLYGSPYKTWPRLEAEAANALVFDNYYTHIANTANSLVSITLSIYPHPIDWHEITKDRPHIAGDTAAQVLRQRGYRTAFVSAGYNEHADQNAFLEGRGFDVIWGANDVAPAPLNTWGAEDKYMVDGVLKFIDQDPSRPFCVYSWTQGTHHPYGGERHQDPPGWEIVDFQTQRDESRWGKMWWDLNRYCNALRETDRQIARLLDGLRQRGLADDTLVVITGDHGEAFGFPHDIYGHMGEVWDECVHVPFLLWNPVIFKGAGRSGVLGGHIDLSPTVLDILGVEQPGSWQGRSLLSPNRSGRTYVYGVYDAAVLENPGPRWKYILHAAEATQRLYDRSRDPDEQTDLSAAQADLCQQNRRRVGAWVDYQTRLIAGRPDLPAGK